MNLRRNFWTILERKQDPDLWLGFIYTEVKDCIVFVIIEQQLDFTSTISLV